jgi:phospholipid-binding lipoprotein MlaA
MKDLAKYARLTGAAAVFALVAGCATGPNANPADPFEPFNRGVFELQRRLDEAVLVPVPRRTRRCCPRWCARA